MEYSSLTDLGWDKDGKDLGFNWTIDHTKTDQQHRLVIPIPDKTNANVSVGGHLRVFRLVAPREGKVFRHTRIEKGQNGLQSWEVPYEEVKVVDKWGNVTYEQRAVGFESGRWNERLRDIIREACPEVTAELYSAHSLRAGGASAALASGVPVEMVKGMLAHDDINSTLVYTRPGEEQLRQAFASVTGPRAHQGG
jgi:hypothetical protein